MPAVLRFLSGQFVAKGSTPPSASDRLALEAALRTWPAKEVLQQLLQELRGDSPLAVRLVALRLAGNVRDARALDALDQLCGLVPAAQKRQPVVREALESALAEVLQADERALDAALRMARNKSTQEALFVPLASALGRIGASRGLAVLEALLGRNDELDLAVLEALGNLGIRACSRDVEVATRLLRKYIEAPEPRLRRAALIAFGRARVGDVVPELVGLLDDRDRRAKLASLWALEQISGLELGDDPPEWELWHQREVAWYRETWPARLEAVNGSDVVAAVAALRELAQHPAFRRDLAHGVVQGAIQHADPAVAVAACGTLAKLGGPGSIEGLIDALQDSREDVRVEAAVRALHVLTGEALPASETAWRSWLERG